MSSNYNSDGNSQNATISEEDDGGGGVDGDTRSVLATTTTITPQNQNDRILASVPSPLLSSVDPQTKVAPYPPDIIITPIDKINHDKKADYNSKAHHSSSRRPKPSREHERQHHRHARNNQIHVIESPHQTKDHVPENTNESTIGVWIGSFCFIQCGKNARKRQTVLPTTATTTIQNSTKKTHQCCCGRRVWVVTAFLTVVMIAVLFFFIWPRIPLIRIEGAINTIPTKVTQTQQGGRTSNVAFESTWLLNMTMDNRRNYLTTRFNRIQIIVKDTMTGLLIGKGSNNNADDGTAIYLPGRAISTIQLPISVNYQARDTTDTTFSNLVRACNVNSTTSNEANHHALPIHFWFTLYFFGLDWLGYKPTIIATPATGGFFCPS
ncbi:hypothetical protein [Parasitella parasitica]|uniref:Uncharacterized protein n=1 Tax=Parasitella parasitica TaxID=35722 RepID=A0A0B7NEG6_9FUNG|nr:hypothetical protein [Parasitella parasitica]